MNLAKVHQEIITLIKSQTNVINSRQSFVIIGLIISLAIVGIIVAYVKIPSLIFARRDRRVQESKLES